MKYPLTGIDLTALRSHKGNPELVCDNLCACEVTSRYTGRSCRGHAALAWESDALVRSHCRHDALSRPRRPALPPLAATLNRSTSIIMNLTHFYFHSDITITTKACDKSENLIVVIVIHLV